MTDTRNNAVRVKAVINGALVEAGAIVRSGGYKLAAAAPFLLLAFAIVASIYLASRDPYQALLITSDDPVLAEATANRLDQVIGPNAPQSALRDQNAGFVIPTAQAAQLGADVMVDGESRVAAWRAHIDASEGDQLLVRFDATSDYPAYLADLIRIAALESALSLQSEQPVISRVVVDAINTEEVGLSTHLIVLISVGMAGAIGAMSAAASYALTTAYLEKEGAGPRYAGNARERFLSKLIGIGAAYSGLAVPWGIVAAIALYSLAGMGDAPVQTAMKEATLSLLDPRRLLLFLIGAIGGYVTYASLILTFARRARTSADARSYAGPASMIAIAPAPLALWLSEHPMDAGFQALTWLPFTSPAAIQIGFGAVDFIDLLIRSVFLIFVALCAVRIAFARL